MATIELGELPSAGTADEDLPGGPRATSRWPRLGVLLAVLLAAVTGSAPSPRPATESTVPARLGALIVTGDDRLFVIDPVVDPVASGQWLAAFRLPGGNPLWRVPMPLRDPVGGSVVVGRTLLLTAAWGSLSRRETVALDTATGQVRWRRAATFTEVVDGGDLLLWAPSGEPAITVEPAGTGLGPSLAHIVEPAGTLSVLAADGGEVRWSLPLPAGAVRSYRYEADPDAISGGSGAYQGMGLARAVEMVVSYPTGRVEVRDLATGDVLRFAELPRSRPAGGPLTHRVAGDLLLVDDTRRSVTAYGLDRLDRRWRMNRNPGREFGPAACGTDLCLHGWRGGVRVVDSATGRTRWADDRWETITWAAGHLLVGGPGRSGVAPLTVLDAASGRVLGELGAWQLIGSWAGVARLIGVRVGTDGRALVAELDPAAGTVRVRETLRDVSGECAAVGEQTLTCRRLDGSVGVWTLRDAPWV